MTLIAESDKTDRLIERQNEDVAEWQALDIQNHNESLEDWEEKTTEWVIGNARALNDSDVQHSRWEMDLDAKFPKPVPSRVHGAALRKFAERCEGDLTTTVYHIIA